jgi:hypothetical protein
MWPAPAPSTSSFWSDYSAAIASRSRPASVTTPAKKPHKPAPVHIEPKRELTCARGFAAKTGVWYERESKMKQWAPGCFNPFFRQLVAGERRVGLWIDHDPNNELCSTAGALHIWQTANGEIKFKVDDSTRGGRKALRFLRDHPEYRECSLGAAVLSFQDGTEDRYILAAVINEISFVERGYFPSTWVELE